MLNRAAALLVVIAIAALRLGTHTPVQAQQASPPILEVTISPKFSAPLILRGTSGGLVPGKNVAGRAETANGPCVGFVDEKPNHTLVVTDFFKYLGLQVQSPKDTTIIVRGPGGSWCNDDFKGKNPGIAGQWLAGTYSVWVGSYDPTKYYPYILQITESPDSATSLLESSDV